MWQCKNLLYTIICFYTGTTPSWTETQPWSFVVVESTAVKGNVMLVNVLRIAFNISKLRAFSSAWLLWLSTLTLSISKGRKGENPFDNPFKVNANLDFNVFFIL